MTDADAAPPTNTAAPLRLFFALWPDDETRARLNRAGKWLDKHWGGRRMRADTLHLTLAFLGETPHERLEALIAGAGRIAAEPFELVLDRAGYWRHNRIGWLGASETPAPHAQLVETLNEALRTGGFPVDPRPHVPHVTLLRNSLGGAVPACVPVRWPVRDFVLVKSVTAPEGARYAVLQRWPLAVAAGTP